ncbi:MAG: hypothetical protein ACKOWF_07040 [Chloroflexota bacterium]
MTGPEPSPAMSELAACAGIDPELLEREEVAVYLRDMARALRDLYGDSNPPALTGFDPEWPEERE